MAVYGYDPTRDDRVLIMDHHAETAGDYQNACRGKLYEPGWVPRVTLLDVPHGTCAHADTLDSDDCLQAAPEWDTSFTCASSTSFCASWQKNMHRCCPQSCGVSPLCTFSDCHILPDTIKGTCWYPRPVASSFSMRVLGGARANVYASENFLGQMKAFRPGRFPGFTGSQQPISLQVYGHGTGGTSDGASAIQLTAKWELMASIDR